MKLLCIESSTSTASVALFDHSGLLVESVFLDDSRKHSQVVLPSVDRMLAAAKMKPSDLDGVAATRGPGSFTSVRVCLATAWGLARALGIPLYAVDTLEVLSRAAQDTCRRRQVPGPTMVLSALDARRDQVYAALYEGQGQGNAVVAPAAFDPPDLVAAVGAREGVMVLGDGALRYREVFEQAGFTVPEHPDFHRLRASLVGRAVLRHPPHYHQNGMPEPLYLRKSEAERAQEGRPNPGAANP